MTIDDAIEHAEEIACGNDQCAKDHAQLADWLREFRRARMEIDLLKTLRDGFKADARKYKDENARLRELVSLMYRNMQGVLDCSTDTVFVNSFMTLRDHMDECMEVMAELGMPPRDYESRRRELGLED